MARIRSIKPGFCTSESIADLPIEARLHFIMLWTYADDEGRGRDNPRLIKAELWPLDDEISIEQVEEWQQLLADNGRIIRYTNCGKPFFQITNWAEHQHPKHYKDSTYPSLDDEGSETVPDQETPGQTHGPEPAPIRPPMSPKAGLGEGEGEGEGEGVYCADFEKSDAISTTRQSRPRDEIFEAIAFVSNQPIEELTSSARGALNRATSEIRKARGSPEQVLARSVEYRLRFPDMALTPSALAKHWPALANPIPRVSKADAQLTRLAMKRGEHGAA